MEVLQKRDYREFEIFTSNFSKVAFQQSASWGKVKKGWTQKIVVSRNENDEIVGAMSVLIRKIGMFSLMYAPRGPVCDYTNSKVMNDLLEGANQLAKEHSAFKFICDPLILEEDKNLIDKMKEYGFCISKNAHFDDTIQPRYNYMLTNIKNLDEENLLYRFSANTRHKIRLAKNRGVYIKTGDDLIDDFYSMYIETGLRKKFNIRPKVYIKSVLEEMGENAKLFICYYNEEPLCGAIAITSGDTTSYVYGASTDKYRNLMPTYLLQYEMIKWASENGSGIYDMQGICIDETVDPELYKVYKFKCNFSGDVVVTAGEFEIVYNKIANFAFKQAKSLRDTISYIKRVVD